MQRIVLLLCAVVASTGNPRSASADKASSEPLFRVGTRAYEAGRFDDAARAMEAAYQEWPSPDIAFSAAQAHRLAFFASRSTTSLNRAVELYRLYLREVPAGGRRKDAALNLAELEPMVRSANPVEERVAKPETRVGISAAVDGAEISIDGGKFFAAPVFATVAPGKHSYRARAPGHFRKEGAVQVFDGQFAVAEVELAPIPARVRVEVRGGAEVYVEGRRASTPSRLELTPGRHRIDIARRGHVLVSVERDFAKDTQTVVTTQLELTSRRKIALGLFASSGAAFVAALGTGLGALDAHLEASDLDDIRLARGLSAEQRDDFNRFLDSRGRRLTATYVLVGTGVGLAAAASLAYYFDIPDVPKGISPTLSSSGVGVQGAF